MTNKLDKLGWLIAALMLGIIAGSGFQDGPLKFAVVDITSVVEKSDFGKKNQDDFAAMKTAREGVLEFIDQYRVLSVAQANELKELSIKIVLTTEDKTKLEKIKTDVKAAKTKSDNLAQKTTQLTPEETKLLQEYANQAANMEQTAQDWLRVFTNELQAWADKQKLESLNRARAAVQEIGKAQGFTIVFEVGIAPYGANDLTDAALKAMNAKKI
jgi:Skp family chaperone for outer membrane proteins